MWPVVLVLGLGLVLKSLALSLMVVLGLGLVLKSFALALMVVLGLGLVIKSLALCSSPWPWPCAQVHGLGRDGGPWP